MLAAPGCDGPQGDVASEPLGRTRIPPLYVDDLISHWSRSLDPVLRQPSGRQGFVARVRHRRDLASKVLIAAAITAIAVVLAFYPCREPRRRSAPAHWARRIGLHDELGGQPDRVQRGVGTILAANFLPTGINANVTNDVRRPDVLFGLAAVIGPFIYIVLQRRSRRRDQGQTRPRRRSIRARLGGFLLGTTVVLWAAFASSRRAS